MTDTPSAGWREVYEWAGSSAAHEPREADDGEPSVPIEVQVMLAAGGPVGIV